MTRARKIYVAGALANPFITEVALRLRAEGHEVFDDWHAAGPEADTRWQEYEAKRGRTYLEAINGHHAVDVFDFDLRNIMACDTFILVLPAGKSGHMEVGLARGEGKECHVLFAGEPDRYDLMYRMVHGIWMSVDELVEGLAANIRNVV
jgi:hypothetical protein